MRLRATTLAVLFACAGIFALDAGQALAQDAPSPDAPPVSNAPDTTQQDEQLPTTTLKVNVNLVSNYFSVRDKHNGLVSTLTKQDCTILEDKVPADHQELGPPKPISP